RGRARVVHHAVASVDAHVTRLVDEVTGASLRRGDPGAGRRLGAGRARQVDAHLAEDEGGVPGAVPAAGGGAAVDVGNAGVLLGDRDDLLGLRAVRQRDVAAALGLVGVAGLRVARAGVAGLTVVGAHARIGGANRLRLGLRRLRGGDVGDGGGAGDGLVVRVLTD